MPACLSTSNDGRLPGWLDVDVRVSWTAGTLGSSPPNEWGGRLSPALRRPRWESRVLTPLRASARVAEAAAAAALVSAARLRSADGSRLARVLS